MIRDSFGSSYQAITVLTDFFFPASGNYNGTTLNNRGSNGNYWSSSFISATNAYNLNFNSSNVNPANNNNRRYGFSVRAVQHSLEKTRNANGIIHSNTTTTRTSWHTP